MIRSPAQWQVGTEAPTGRRAHQGNGAFALPPTLQSQPGRTPSSPAQGPGTFAQPRASLAHSEGQQARAGLPILVFFWGGDRGRRQCPIPRPKPTQACRLVLVCPLAQVGMAEQRPRCRPQRPQAGLPGPHLSTPSRESSLGKDTEG